MKKIGLLTLTIMMVSFIGCNSSDNNAEHTNEAGKTDGAAATKTKPNYGKIQHVDIKPEIDKAMAEQGLRIFDVTCTSCHKYDERYVGPPLRSVTKTRTPEYVMNMILDTETMIDNDDTVKCLLQEYMLKMPNMQVDEKDARSVLEHLREVAQQ